MKSKDVPDLGIAIYDLHVPFHDKDVWDIALQIAEDNRERLKLFLFGGDTTDCRFLARFNEGQPRLLGNMKRDLDKLESLLTPLDPILPDDCERIAIEGNHEERVERFLLQHEEFRGVLDVNAALKKYGFRIIPQGGSYRFRRSKLEWMHGDTIGGNAETSCKRGLEMYCGPIAFGHFHRITSATKVLKHSRKDKWQAWSLPCACNLDAGYLKGKPTGWLAGLTVTEFFEDGTFNLFPIAVFKGKAAYGGKIYRARRR